MYDLKGKVALVTGAGGKLGLGRAIAVRLAAEGADVAVNDLAARQERADGWAGLPDVVAEIEGMGRHALSVAADVSQADQVTAMFERTVAHFGRLDILVCNAGAPAGRDRVPVLELEEEAWDLIQNVNAKGTFLCCQAAARQMIGQGQGGKIINISSLSGKRGVARFAAYCASKFAIRGFSQALAMELAPHGIHVNVICPGLAETERLDDMAAALAPQGTGADAYRQQMVARIAAANPMGRLAQAADVARVAAFLASSESDYLTGLSIPVAGGSYMD